MNGLLVHRAAFAWQSFAGLATVLVIIGITTSLITRDMHHLARFGALIAAVGAVLVIVQIRFDMVVEREFQALLRRIDEGDEAVLSPVLDEATARIKQQSKARAQEEVKASRTSAAIIVAAITACGEILHGWGDVVMHILVALAF